MAVEASGRSPLVVAHFAVLFIVVGAAVRVVMALGAAVESREVLPVEGVAIGAG